MKLTELFLRMIVAATLQLFGFISPNNARYGKRLMFLTSVYAVLVKERVLQEMSLESFNDTFHLADDPKMLDATTIARGCWQKINLRSEFVKCVTYNENLDTKENRLNLVERFTPIVVRQTPKWMNYGDDEMKRDVANIFLVNGFTKDFKQQLA